MFAKFKSVLQLLFATLLMVGSIYLGYVGLVAYFGRVLSSLPWICIGPNTEYIGIFPPLYFWLCS